MSEPSLPTLEIPEKWRTFVYIIGMLGFPIVIASYILVVLSSDIKSVDKSLNSLATRIDERPMGVEKSTDFIIYITDSLRTDLESGFPGLIKAMNFHSKQDNKSLSKNISIIKRQIDAYIRPIVRKHQRFASRFPTEGGNLGSLFKLYSPSENIEAGETEAHLRGKTTKEFSEALSAMLTNNLAQFTEVDLKAMMPKDNEVMKQLEELFRKPNPANDTEQDGSEKTQPSTDTVELIDSNRFLELSLDSIETATTVLRDQMLEEIRLHGTKLEK